MTDHDICEKQRANGNSDPTVDASMVMKPKATNRIVDTTADYRELCSLRKELLAFDLTDPTHTRITLLAYIRDLQLRCLSHLPLDW